jgi:hypothetical protein
VPGLSFLGSSCGSTVDLYEWRSRANIWATGRGKSDGM